MPPIEAPRKFSQPFYLSSDQNNNSENIINCEYYHIDEIQTLSKNIEDLEYLLNLASTHFDVIAISETRIVKGKTPVNSLN